MKRRIKILPSKRIDTHKWDQCVAQHGNGLIYSSTAYLSAMAPDWHGVVVDDYTAVMAIPWKRKFRIRYMYMPPFMQQLGVVGEISDTDLAKILKVVYRFIALGDIHFNFSNTGIQQLLPVIPRNNFVIALSEGYDRVSSQFKNNLKENIRKATSDSLLYAEGDIQEGIAMYHAHYKERIKHVKEKDYARFGALCKSLHACGQSFARVARNNKNEVLAMAVFVKDNKRIYNIMNTTTGEGRSREANHFLIDQVIREFAGVSLLFDFEGSELPGVRAFYEHFGPSNQPYFYYHYNGYAWPLHLLKG